MDAREQEARLRAERARRVALFRYELIQDVIDPALVDPPARADGAGVGRTREHDGPFGEKVRVARNTIDRWCRWWRTGGFAALVPKPARVPPRTPAEVLDLAAAVKKENLGRTATQVARILRAQSGWSPSERTLQRHFERLELHAPPPTVGGGVRPVRGGPAQRDLDRRRVARPPGRRPEDVLVRLSRRSFAGGDGRPVRVRRGHRAPGRGAAPSPGHPRRSGSGLRRQRVRVRGLVAAARLRHSGHQTHPLHPGPAAGTEGRSNGSSAPCANSSWSNCPHQTLTGRRSRTWPR